MFFLCDAFLKFFSIAFLGALICLSCRSNIQENLYEKQKNTFLKTKTEFPKKTFINPLTENMGLTHKAQIIKIIHLEKYTYIKFITQDNKKNWAAVLKSDLKKGDTVFIEENIVKKNFHSRPLEKVFSTIIFGRLIDPPK